MDSWPEIKIFLLKLLALLVLSPLIGYAVLQIVENLDKAKKKFGKQKWLALSIVGFLIGILLGWLQ